MQRRVRVVTSHNPLPSDGPRFEGEVYKAQPIDLENHQQMEEVDRGNAHVHTIASSSTTRVKRIPVPVPLNDPLNDPFSDDSQISDGSIYSDSVPNPFAHPDDESLRTLSMLSTQSSSRFSSDGSRDGDGYTSGELTPKAIQQSRFSDSTLDQEGYTSGELTPKALESNRFSVGSSLVGEKETEQESRAMEPSRLSASSSLAGQSYVPSVDGSVSWVMLIIITA